MKASEKMKIIEESIELGDYFTSEVKWLFKRLKKAESIMHQHIANPCYFCEEYKTFKEFLEEKV
jgi:hypothetical protein